MTLNYIRLAFRLMVRNPFITLINVIGLAVGFSVFFVLWQHSKNELQSDQQWKDSDRIVRCGFFWHWTDDGKIWSQSQFAHLWPEIGKKVREDFPDIEQMTRLFRQENFTAEHIPEHGKQIFFTRTNENNERISFRENNVAYADPNFFTFFSIDLLKGNRQYILSEVNSMVISESLARRYFGEGDPINKLLLLNDQIALKITGIFRDFPANTHFDFQAVISDVGIQKNIDQVYFALGGPHTYFKLRKNVAYHEFEKKLNSNAFTYFENKIKGNGDESVHGEFYLQPLSEVPFTNYRWDYFKTKSKFFQQVLASISLLILAVALVNYLQLSTAHYRKRIKEFGIRKTNGAKMRDFVRQFMLESLLVNVASLLLALTFVQLIRAPLELFFEFHTPSGSEIDINTILIFVAVFVGAVSISALAPLWIIRKKDAQSLLKVTSVSKTKLNPYDWLVTFQFSVSIILIVWVFTVFSQIQYILNADLGLNRKEVIIVDLPLSKSLNFSTHFRSFMTAVKNAKGITQSTSFTSITGDADNNMICLEVSGTTNNVCVDTNGGVDENFIPFFEIKLIAGRNFKLDYAADSTTIVLSRTAITRLGYPSPEDAIGKMVRVNTGSWSAQAFRNAEVIGVVEDYYGGKTSLITNQGMGSGHGGIILTYNDNFIPSSKPEKIALRVSMDQYTEVVNELEKLYTDMFPGQLFRAYFLDEQINRFYMREETTRNQILLFTVIAMGIACLGLLGMVSNKVTEKIKEIGIRKVLGAQLVDIGSILLNATLKQIAFAVVIGLPIAFYLTEEYLQRYSKRIEVQFWHLGLPVLLLMIIMLATVSGVIYKAAKSNPVQSLKHE